MLRQGGTTTMSRAGRVRRPAVETCEPRTLLTGAIGFLTGVAYYDPTGTGAISESSPTRAGVTVELYRDGESTPVATTTTDANGRYRFDQPDIGGYTIVQVPRSGEKVIGGRILSQVYPAAPNPLFGPGAIHVTVVNPSFYLNYAGVIPSSYLPLLLNVHGQLLDQAVGPVGATLGTTSGATNLNTGFRTFSLDGLATLSVGGGESFQVLARSIDALGDGQGGFVSPSRAGRIAYLYTHYLDANLDPVSGAALQLAFFELIYDTGATANFTSGNFQVVAGLAPTTSTQLNEAINLATSLFDESAGKDWPAFVLSGRGGNPPGATGIDEMIAVESFDFVNAPVAQSSLGGAVYCDVNNDGVRQPSEPGVAGARVVVAGRDQGGNIVSRTTITDASGAYTFTGLAAGTYSLTETPPAAGDYQIGKVTQGTPGTGTTGVNVISNIVLGTGVNGTNNNFGVAQAAPRVVSNQLIVTNRGPSRIAITLDRAADPTLATKLANYQVTLAVPTRRGVVQQPVGIAAVTLDASRSVIFLTLRSRYNVRSNLTLTLRGWLNPCSLATDFKGRVGLVPPGR